MSHEMEIVTEGAEPSSAAQASRLPPPREPIQIRPATIADLPFIDALQKKHTKQVGWMPTKQLEGKIAGGHVLIAEHCHAEGTREASAFDDQGQILREYAQDDRRVGYLIAQDRYFKRDDVGIIYQLNVLPMKQRNLIGATLIKAMFDRSAYGCKLYCCWCAQDIEANHFWEALGFVPLAFRAGSEKKRRVHIFWCKRIREGDTSTPWWFPAETKGGSMMEDRLVLPIPPGTHWSDAKPIVLPGAALRKQLEDAAAPRTLRKTKPAVTTITKPQPLGGGLTFQSPASAQTKIEKPKRQKKEKVRNDPKLVSAARELRDRWLERLNDGHYLPQGAGKYELTRARALPAPEAHLAQKTHLLTAA